MSNYHSAAGSRTALAGHADSALTLHASRSHSLQKKAEPTQVPQVFAAEANWV